MANRREIELKKKMLENIFKSQELKAKGYILLWKNNVKQINMMRDLDRKSKTDILERINRIVSVGSQGNVKRAIQKFHQSMLVTAVQKKFINQLLKTKSGMVLEAFKRWDSIPAINISQKYKDAQRFFYKL